MRPTASSKRLVSQHFSTENRQTPSGEIRLRVCAATTNAALFVALGSTRPCWENDHADLHPDECLVADPVSGEPMNARLIVPRNSQDLDARQKGASAFPAIPAACSGARPTM
jgi:hypothetical protein